MPAAVTSSIMNAELVPALFVAVAVTVYDPTARLVGAFTVFDAVLTVKPVTGAPVALDAVTVTVSGAPPDNMYKTRKAVPCCVV